MGDSEVSLATHGDLACRTPAIWTAAATNLRDQRHCARHLEAGVANFREGYGAAIPALPLLTDDRNLRRPLCPTGGTSEQGSHVVWASPGSLLRDKRVTGPSGAVTADAPDGEPFELTGAEIHLDHASRPKSDILRKRSWPQAQLLVSYACNVGVFSVPLAFHHFVPHPAIARLSQFAEHSLTQTECYSRY